MKLKLIKNDQQLNGTLERINQLWVAKSNTPEIVRFIAILRIKELLSSSQVTEEVALKLDDELKENWWQKNKDTFLGKIQ